MKHKIKHYMAALLLTSMVWSGHAQEKNEMDLSGEWAFQTDVMDFRRGSLDVPTMQASTSSDFLLM